jgi:hypothetical protein
MAMGSASYTYKNPKRKHDFWEIRGNKSTHNSGDKKINHLLVEWDNIYKLTGEPMRFTASGKKITSW